MGTHVEEATGWPPEELVFRLAASKRVWERLPDDVSRAFGILLEGKRVDDDGDGHLVDLDGVKVRFVWRGDGCWSMTLGDEDAER